MPLIVNVEDSDNYSKYAEAYSKLVYLVKHSHRTLQLLIKFNLKLDSFQKQVSAVFLSKFARGLPVLVPR